MSEMTTQAVMVLAGVFLVLALVAILRYDRVKHFLKAFGVEMAIEGEKRPSRGRRPKGEAPEREDKDAMETVSPPESGKASVTIGGRVSKSHVSSEGSGEGHIEVGKGVEGTGLRAKGKRAASAHVEGDVRESDIDVRASDN